MTEIEVRGMSAGKLPLLYEVKSLFQAPTFIPEEEVVKGIDTSRWNGDMNFVTSKNVGTEFVYIKATQGISITDAQFVNSRNKLTGFLPWGAYHFLISTVSGVSQADYFCNILGNNKGELPPVVDVESESISSTIVRDFCVRVYNRLGMYPIIYTSANYWAKVFGSYKSWCSTNCKLWVAHWGTLSPLLPTGWNDYVIHQYSADGNNLGVYYGAPPPPDADYDMDLNRAKKSWLEQYTTITPPPCEYPRVEVIADSLNIRNGPTTSSSVTGYLVKGNQPEKLETIESDGNIWIRIGWKQYAAMKYNDYVYMKDI